jgi:MFS family permease
MKHLLGKNGLIAISNICIGTTIWSFNFILQFSVLRNLNLPFWFVLFFAGGVPLGGLAFSWLSKWDELKLGILSSTLTTAPIIGLVLIQIVNLPENMTALLVIILLGLSGFSNAITVPYAYLISSVIFDNPEFNGRLSLMAYLFISILVILVVFLDSIHATVLVSLVLAIFYMISCLALIGGRSKFEIIPPRCINVSAYLRQKDTYSAHLLSFFLGFFFLNSYYAVVLILGNASLSSGLNEFVMILYTVCFAVALPCGFIYDRLGRRSAILMGFYAQAFAFLLVSFMMLDPITFPLETSLLLVFPIVIGVGLVLTVFGGATVMYEQAPKGYLRVHLGASYAFFGIGMVGGVIVDIILEAIIFTNIAFLPIVLIFAYFTATIVVLQIPETLPSREELEWKNSIEHLLVLSRGGLPLHSQRLSKKEADSSRDEMLVGGAISGISELVREISQSETRMKVIQQEGYCILLEEGRDVIVAVLALNELNAIRTRMQDFLEEFVLFFGELVAEWQGDPKVFSPAKQLVAKHFE